MRKSHFIRSVYRLLRVPAFRWALGLALLGATVALIDPEQLAGAFNGIRWAVAVPAIAGLVLVHSVNAGAWGLMTRLHTGLSLPPRRLLVLYYASQSFGLLTPSNIGSDVFRTTAVAGGAGGWRRAAAPILLQRITSFLALAILGLAASAALPVAAGLRAMVAAVMVTMAVLLSGFIWAQNSRGERFGRFRKLLSTEAVAGDALPSGGRHTILAAGLAGGFAFHLLSLLCAVALLSSLAPGTPAMPALAALALARLAILVPVSISGLGFQEGAAAFLFPLAGLPAELGVAVSVLSRAGLVLTTLTGAACVPFSSVAAGRQVARQEDPPQARVELIENAVGE